MHRGTSHRRPGAAALAAALAAVVAGCGAVGDPAKSSTTRRAAVYGGPAPLLIYFKRVIGVDPLASQLVVDTNGSAAATITLGGVGGQKRHDFMLSAPGLHALRTLIAQTRLLDTPCCNDPGYYLYWVSVAGHTWRLEQRRLPRAARRLIGALNAITDDHTGY